MAPRVSSAISAPVSLCTTLHVLTPHITGFLCVPIQMVDQAAYSSHILLSQPRMPREAGVSPPSLSLSPFFLPL